MAELILDKRLQAAADLVRESCRLVDVGTDHGYLAAWLLKAGKVKSAVASDVNPGPLAAAERTARQYGLTDRMKLVLSEGLCRIDPADAEDIVIAGMGGELIARIVTETPWLRQRDKRLILQPMTHAPYLREALYKQGFGLLAETPVADGNRYYTVMLAAYTGDCRKTDPLFAAVGKLPFSHSPDRSKMLDFLACREEKVAAGLEQSQNRQDHIQRAAAHRTLAKQIREVI